jgi:hypothetical protein
VLAAGSSVAVASVLASAAILVATASGVDAVSTAPASEGHLLDVPSEAQSLVVVSVGGVSVAVPPSAYTIVGPIALKIKTAMMTNERRDARTLIDIDPPSKTKTDKWVSPRLYRRDFSESTKKRLQVFRMMLGKRLRSAEKPRVRQV